MVDRRRLTIAAFALVVAMSGITTEGQQRAAGGAGAQAAGAGGQRAGGGGRSGPFTPDVGAKDLKSVLFNWTWHMGMLRSGNESELVKTLEYEAEGGTVQVNGQPCALKKYRISANYQTPGYRTQIKCTLPNQQTYSNVETMSGDFAWDE